MSIDERVLRRSCLAQGFSKSEDPPSVAEVLSDEKTMISKFYKLKQLLENAMFQWWDIVSLQKYIKVNRAPRGLRITNLCGFLEEDLKDVWLRSSRECSDKVDETEGA